MADVKYIKFGDSGAPQIKVDASLSDEGIKNLLKSERIETAMAEAGYAYKFGLDPVYLLDEDNLNDNAFVAGSKSSIDTLKQIGQGAMDKIYDAFGAETLQQQAIDAVKQYQLDQTAHQWRRSAEGEVKPRFQSLEQVFESEQEFSAFLEWAGAKLGEGLVTTIPFVLAGLVSGGVGAGAIGAGLVAKAWTDSAFKHALIADAGRASRDMGFDIGPMHLIALENTEKVHNVIVCTLCSCYPRNLLGLPPDWYKSRAYLSLIHI